MNSKRMILAVVLVFVTLVVAGFLIQVTWLGSTYQAMRDDGFLFARLTLSSTGCGSSG
jgi:hypothetical protein